MGDEYVEDPDWQYGFTIDDHPTVWGAVFGLPITSRASAEHAVEKSYTHTYEILRHPKGSRRDDDWEPILDTPNNEKEQRDMTIDLHKQDAAAFALYKHENPETVAESWETVGLPIVLAYRKRANVVLAKYLSEQVSS
jgi:hypothetical protein